MSNHTGSTCGLAKASGGTAVVVRLRRDGTDVQPMLTRSFYA